MMALLLLLIPVFCMGISIYAAMLYDYACGTFKAVPFAISLLIVIIIGYILPRLFYKLYKSDSPSSLNGENTIFNLSNYISYIVLLGFGIAMLIKFIKFKSSYLEIYLAAGIVFLFIYITYVYFLDFRKYEFEIIDVVEKNKKTNMLMIENKEFGILEFYADPSIEFKIGKKYKFKYNKNSKVFKNYKCEKKQETK